MPLVSVVIPAYNAERTLKASIDSVLVQDFRDFEIIVVNDGSSDSTKSILAAYDSQIQVIDQNNRGAPAARNTGVRAARGKYIAFLDSDDLWNPDKLTQSVHALEANPSASLVFTDCRGLRADGTGSTFYSYSGAPSLKEMLDNGFEIVPSAVTIRRDVFEACGGFSDRFAPIYFEDLWLWFLARELGEFEYIPKELTTIRLRDKRLADSYFVNGRTYIELLRQRYGHRARGAIRQAYNHLAGVSVHEALRRMDAGDRWAALAWWIYAIRLRPTLIAEWGGRAFRPRNLRRLARTVSPSSKVS
ncbi:MAG TPA: glycosyltransferase family A protein [Candidatus Binatus sp.]|nr:glycosyltransferase family A protein [Candidatus Binatus sp.]